MNEVASDIEIGEPACREMLSTLLQRKIGKVRVVPQKNIPPGHPEYRGIIMDVEVEEDIEGINDNILTMSWKQCFKHILMERMNNI